MKISEEHLDRLYPEYCDTEEYKDTIRCKVEFDKSKKRLVLVEEAYELYAKLLNETAMEFQHAYCEYAKCLEKLSQRIKK